MCHCSAECYDCCKVCKKDCIGQVCGLLTNAEDQNKRLEAWLNIVTHK
jgi:hypothetical protein